MKTLRLCIVVLFGWCCALGIQAQEAPEYVWAPALAVGDTIPLLDAPDQHGKQRSLADLAGARGLVLFFNRSFDWCPFCKAQLKSLVADASAFEALGFGLATMTYDPVATLLLVTDDEAVTFPLLHDAAARHVMAFGILNEDYAPGHRAYGVPHPGIMVIDPAGKILLKFAEADFRERPDLAVVLDALRALP